MNLLGKIIRWGLSLPKTIFFNFYLFPINVALKLPILVDYRTKFDELHKGTVTLKGSLKFGMIKIGWGSGSKGIECNQYSYWGVKEECNVIFMGTAHFVQGVSLRADNKGTIIFGNNFSANQNFFCASNTRISFGDNVLAGWNVHVRDGDGHEIFNEKNEVINKNRGIFIGNHVWLASYASILKGTKISDNSIVGFGSIVTKSFSEENVIIGGIPASVVKRNISWKA